jgi:hypothetical protein
MDINQRYKDHYTPLVKSFCEEVSATVTIEPDKLPEPFLPQYGSDYEHSALRVAFVGQDTKKWGDLKSFVANGIDTPLVCLEKNRDEFRSHHFTGWGSSRQKFWGFVMMFLARLHGIENWSLMKRGRCREILSSFAWGNGNAIEYWQSSAKGKCSIEFWKKIRRLGERFNGIDHLIKTIAPQVVVVLWKGMNPGTYFSGYQVQTLHSVEDVKHFYLPEVNVHVFHTLHPRRMNFEKGNDWYCDQLVTCFRAHGFSVTFPKIADINSDSLAVFEYLNRTAPGHSPNFHKFACVDWVANELKKQDVCMTAKALCVLLNELGYRTDRGTLFSLERRGPYQIVKATYHWLKSKGLDERADVVAKAFLNADNEYAYE